MVLEATMVVLDTSEHMRNGDYPPSRLEAQQDALNLVGGAKTQSNPENSVGVLASGGKGVEVLVTLTQDIGKILGCGQSARPSGKSNLLAGIQVAQLALKHRQNKNQRQRIIAFVGSPVTEDEAALVKLGKKLKKNAVAVDVVNFGEEAENAAKLEAFVHAVNNDDNSHLVTIPPGPHILSDILISSPIVASNEDGVGAGVAAAGGAAGAGGTGDAFAEFGVDPSMDPEFAWALRVSLEEERQRQEAEAKARAEAGAPGAAAAAPAGAGAPSEAPAVGAGGAGVGGGGRSDGDVQMAEADAGDDDEAAMLQAAIEMSMATEAASAPQQPAQDGTSAVAEAPAAVTGDVPMVEAAADEEAAIQAALALSMQEDLAATASAAAPQESAAGGASQEQGALLQDPAFVHSVLGSLPGVDVNDPRIQAALAKGVGSKEEKKEDKGKEDKEGN